MELLGRKINVIVENELDLTEGEIGAFLQEAMARSRGDINNLPDTFVFAILDSSSHLFEDHIRNGFIGINRSVIEIENEKTRKALLRIGLVHELSHEFTAQKGKSFEKRQLERDTDLAVEIFQGDDEGFKELAAELKNLLATTEFMEKTRIKKRKIERIVRRTHTANQGTLATAKRYLEKTLMESKAKGEEIPVDIVVDLSLLPQEKIEDSMETWSNLVLSCLEIDNVNFIFEVPEFKGKKNISFGLKKAIGKAAKSSEVLKLLVEKTMKNATSFGWCGNYVCQKIEAL